VRWCLCPPKAVSTKIECPYKQMGLARLLLYSTNCPMDINWPTRARGTGGQGEKPYTRARTQLLCLGTTTAPTKGAAPGRDFTHTRRDC
jgi:hypothetical protein